MKIFFVIDSVQIAASDSVTRALSAILVALLLASCATSMPGPKPETTTVPNGFWEGSIRIGNLVSGQKINPGPHAIRIVACDGRARVWSLDSAGGPEFTPQITFDVVSLVGTHVLTHMHAASKQPDWVEVQKWILSEVDPSTMAVHWSRTVSNRDLEPTHADRTFAEFGLGALRRVRETCTAADLLPTAKHGNKLTN